jgi:hypothetical protein
MKKSGKTKSGDRIDLCIDDENRQYAVCWFELCGYDMVVMQFAFGDEAEAFYNAVLAVCEVDWCEMGD